MQTYAVVDSDFRFVKIGRTGDLETRLATLNTASPRPLILMALFDGDIESSMHSVLARHRERLEWFRYNDEVETTIIARMNPTKEWFQSRKDERQRRKRSNSADQMGAVNVALLSREQRDRIAGITESGQDEFGAMFGIPSESVLSGVVRRAHQEELLATRRTLAACGRTVQSELEAARTDSSYERVKVALFARRLINNWRRRIGIELGAIQCSRVPNVLS